MVIFRWLWALACWALAVGGMLAFVHYDPEPIATAIAALVIIVNGFLVLPRRG